jgi:hypothetical protein
MQERYFIILPLPSLVYFVCSHYQVSWEYFVLSSIGTMIFITFDRDYSFLFHTNYFTAAPKSYIHPRRLFTLI